MITDVITMALQLLPDTPFVSAIVYGMILWMFVQIFRLVKRNEA